MIYPLDMRIQAAILRNPHKTDGQIAKNMGTTVGEVRRVRATMGDIPSQPQAQTAVNGGIPLTGLTVSLRKPAESAASFIRRLPKDNGYLPDDLGRQWGISPETIKRHAKDHNCLRFVEVSDGEWSAMIMHPETAAKYSI